MEHLSSAAGEIELSSSGCSDVMYIAAHPLSSNWVTRDVL